MRRRVVIPIFQNIDRWSHIKSMANRRRSRIVARIRNDAEPGYQAHANPPGRHFQRGFRVRHALHDPGGKGGYRRSGASGQARRRGQSRPGRIQGAICRKRLTRLSKGYGTPRNDIPGSSPPSCFRASDAGPRLLNFTNQASPFFGSCPGFIAPG